MRYEVLPYTEPWTAAVERLNRRLLDGGLDPQLLFPETHRSPLPRVKSLRWRMSSVSCFSTVSGVALC